MLNRSVTVHRVFISIPDKIYKAFLDPDALSKFLPPNGFTGKVHSLDAKVGGSYKMSFTNLGTGASHSFGGIYMELVKNEKIVIVDKFDDVNLKGEMKTTVTITKVSVGAEVTITQEGLPQEIPVEACYLGWQQSLDLLALLVEADIP
jgi:uncharacterized protein YndB with AHSA1/START domain